MAVDIIARAMAAEASSGGKDVDYGSVTNKPQINGITLEGNKTTSDLGIGEIIELVGTQNNPVNLYELIDSGIYKISGAYKVIESSRITVIPEPLLLIVFDNSVMYGDRLIRSGTQIYFGSDRTLDIRSRFFYSGTKFNTVFTTHRFGSLNSSDDINTNTFVSVANLATYIGNPNLANVDVLLTKLKTTDKKSLVNAINELVDTKQDKLTAGSGITIENNVISASGGIPSFVGTQDNPITLTSNDIVKEPICLISGYIVDSPVYKNRNIEDTLILYNLTDRDTIGRWRRKTQVIYVGYGALTNIFTAFYSYTRDIQLDTSSDLWSVSRDWRTGYCNYEYSQYYESAQPGLQLFNQRGAHNMYIELMSYLTDTVSNKPLLSGLETTNKSSLVAAINEVAKGSGGSAFPIIDATGETEIDLDNYLDDGTWIIKGNNVKQMKTLNILTLQETPWAILTIKTVNHVQNNFVYQVLTFPTVAFYNGAMQTFGGMAIRQIKPTIVSSFTTYGTPTKITDEYKPSYSPDSQQIALSQTGSRNLYDEIKNAIGTFNSSTVLARLSNLTTTDKTSLIAAINEINAKISSGTLAMNLAEVQGYDGTKTQVLKNISGQFMWVDEN